MRLICFLQLSGSKRISERPLRDLENIKRETYQVCLEYQIVQMNKITFNKKKKLWDILGYFRSQCGSLIHEDTVVF